MDLYTELYNFCVPIVTAAISDTYKRSTDRDDPERNHFLVRLHVMKPANIALIIRDEYYVDYFNTLWRQRETDNKLANIMTLTGMTHISCAFLFVYDIVTNMTNDIMKVMHKTTGLVGSDDDMNKFIDKCANTWMTQIRNSLTTVIYSCSSDCVSCPNADDLFARYFTKQNDSDSDNGTDSD